MTFSWTDQCLLAVLFIGLILCLFGLRKEHVRRAFGQLVNKPLSASAGIILLFFLSIGILDSIHLKPSKDYLQSHPDNGKGDSILDNILAPLDVFYEKTYSAPLSLKLYSSETIYVEGKAQQVYSRLKYLPPSIKTGQDRQVLLTKILLKAGLMSLLVTLLIWVFIFAFKRFWFANKKWLPGPNRILPIVTFLFCVFFLLAGYWISRNFHFFGTGKIGQDIFYYTIKSVRTGLVIGILTTLFMLPLALLLGIAAGYFGGIIDDIIQYIYTTLSSIPGVLLITASVLSMQTYIANHPEEFTTLSQSADARLLALCLILGVTSWTGLCRLLRAEALKLKEIDYVLAARALGSSAFWIIRKHLLPNVMHIVLITLVLDFSFLVLAEAVLSYVGVGVSPMTISWGNMINGARLELAREPLVWWPMMAAFFFMFTLVLASNLFADAVRDAFDPHQAST